MRPIAVLLAGALLAACGGDGGDGELSVEEYRDKANQLCTEANRDVREVDPPTSPDQLADFLERGLKLSRGYDERFEDLDPPPELEELHERAIRLSERVNQKFERLIEDLRSAGEPLAEFQQGLQGLLPDIQAGDSLNRELKLDRCLEVPGLQGGTPGST